MVHTTTARSLAGGDVGWGVVVVVVATLATTHQKQNAMLQRRYPCCQLRFDLPRAGSPPTSCDHPVVTGREDTRLDVRAVGVVALESG